jgi:hypothetical protein
VIALVIIVAGPVYLGIRYQRRDPDPEPPSKRYRGWY